ncbi:alpha/beta hydrolase [Streptacidiphilus cavernicola]|uniref:Alpha/beta hydrolase n=1 Tax=Streptacidiphilus cavernicola TaxID=3342716 RepID=A0ABV6W560_9ACTN
MTTSLEPVPESSLPESSGPEPATKRSIGRITLMVIAVVIGLYILIAQLLAVIPVHWTKPALQWAPTQMAILGIDIYIRDPLGSWNLVLAVVAVVAAILAWRARATRWARIVSVGTSVGLVLSIVAAIGLAAVAHTATGKWILFAPSVPFLQAGDAPNETITYATLDGKPIQADLYLPAKSNTPAPLVVSIHGGGFIGGSKRTNPFTTWLAGHGYAVMDVEYRLADKDHPRWNTADADVGCAITWAVANASHYHWDMNRVATMGDSAGGNLSINVAYKSNNGALQPTCGTAADLPKIRAAVAEYPAVDLTDSGTDTAMGDQLTPKYIGGSVAEYPDRYAATDSAPQISPKSPPTLILQGGNDHLVLASRTAAFVQKLTDAGITNRTIQFPFTDHGFGLVDLGTQAQAGRIAVLDWLERYDGS